MRDGSPYQAAFLLQLEEGNVCALLTHDVTAMCTYYEAISSHVSYDSSLQYAADLSFLRQMKINSDCG